MLINLNLKPKPQSRFGCQIEPYVMSCRMSLSPKNFQKLSIVFLFLFLVLLYGALESEYKNVLI
jgi:hypothetical protein